MTEKQKSELASVLAELYQIKRQLSTSTVSYCRERLEESIERLERMLAPGKKVGAPGTPEG